MYTLNDFIRITKLSLTAKDLQWYLKDQIQKQNVGNLLLILFRTVLISCLVRLFCTSKSLFCWAMRAVISLFCSSTPSSFLRWSVSRVLHQISITTNYFNKHFHIFDIFLVELTLSSIPRRLCWNVCGDSCNRVCSCELDSEGIFNVILLKV